MFTIPKVRSGESEETRDRELELIQEQIQDMLPERQSLDQTEEEQQQQQQQDNSSPRYSKLFIGIWSSS